MQLVTIRLCTKFLNPKSSSCWEIFARKKCPHVLNKSDRRKNEKLEKEGEIRISISIFMYTIQFAYLKVYTKIYNTGSNRSWDISDGNSHWREKKMNKSRDWKAICYFVLLHNRSLILIKLCTKFQSPKSSSCWETFGKKVYRQTNRQTKNA